ncbi:MAG: SH3-like domain-containing protein [Litoreibacter sp.]
MMPKFVAQDRVIISKGYPIGHCRTPWYVRGLEGTIERHCGDFANPEELAYRRDGLPKIPLYRVRISMCAMWSDYVGPTKDTLEVEVFEHWLELSTTLKEAR